MSKFLLKEKQNISLFYKYWKQNIAYLCVTPQKWYSTIKQLKKILRCVKIEIFIFILLLKQKYNVAFIRWLTDKYYLQKSKIR